MGDGGVAYDGTQKDWGPTTHNLLCNSGFRIHLSTRQPACSEQIKGNWSTSKCRKTVGSEKRLPGRRLVSKAD